MTLPPLAALATGSTSAMQLSDTQQAVMAICRQLSREQLVSYAARRCTLVMGPC